MTTPTGIPGNPVQVPLTPPTDFGWNIQTIPSTPWGDLAVITLQTPDAALKLTMTADVLRRLRADLGKADDLLNGLVVPQAGGLLVPASATRG